MRVGFELRQHRPRRECEFDLTFRVVEHDPPRRHVVEGPVLGVATRMAFA